jgi:hypothetical protein
MIDSIGSLCLYLIRQNHNEKRDSKGLEVLLPTTGFVLSRRSSAAKVPLDNTPAALFDQLHEFSGGKKGGTWRFVDRIQAGGTTIC